MDCYVVSSNGTYTQQHQGVGYFKDNKNNHVTRPKFEIVLASGETKEVYVRLFSYYSNMTTWRVQNQTQYNDYTFTRGVLFSLAFGAIIALLLYNLAIFIFNREKAYLYYVLYASALLFWQLSFNGLFPFNKASSTFLFYTNSGISVALLIAFLLLFTRSILEIKQRFPRVDKLFTFFASLLFILGLCTLVFFQETMAIINALASLIFPFLFYMGVKSYLAGNKTALFYIVAQVIFLFTSTLFSLMAEGHISYNVVTRYGLIVGSFMEMSLFSLALAYRIRLLQEDKLTLIRHAKEQLEQKVQERTIELEQSKEALNALANHDPLTNLYNRRYLFELGTKLLTIAKREQTPLSMIMFDIDYFKKVNDTYGHAVGDKVIVAFAGLLNESRQSDVAARIGGEEFVLLLPNTSKENAFEIASKIHVEAKNSKVMLDNGESISYRVSGGVDCLQKGEDIDIHQLLNRADKALYEAKNSGRDKVLVTR